MEMIGFGGLRRRGYNRLSPTNKRSVKIVRLNGTRGNSLKRAWRMRVTPKLKLVKLPSPIKLWFKVKNAYMKMMLNLAITTGTSNAPNVFGTKRIPKSRDTPMAYSKSEFENRLILEIYKSMVSSLELGQNK